MKILIFIASVYAIIVVMPVLGNFGNARIDMINEGRVANINDSGGFISMIINSLIVCVGIYLIVGYKSIYLYKNVMVVLSGILFASFPAIASDFNISFNSSRSI